MDYRKLLLHYIGHVMDCEGTDFINMGITHSDWKKALSDDEWKELENLAQERQDIEQVWYAMTQSVEFSVWLKERYAVKST